MDFDSLCLWTGRIFIFYALYKVTTTLHYLRKLYFLPEPIEFSKYGKWSVVTGSTAGIGKAMAMELASKGQNIFLISLFENELELVAKEIVSKHKVEVKYMQVDFSEDEEIYDKIGNFIKGYDIGVLVNNVGIGHSFSNFDEIPNLSKQIRNLTRVNITSVFKMHQLLLPGMLKKKTGIIINLSSASKLRPLIHMSMYGASKSLVDYFSQSLSYEYEDKGIIIQSLSPSFLKSDLTKNLPIHENLPSAENWVKTALTTIGKERSVFGNLNQTFQGFLTRNIPISRLHKKIKAMKDKRE